MGDIMADEYQITSQSQSIEINPSGQGFHQVWEIHYKVTSGAAKGAVGYITVPDADHNAQYVDDAIRTKLADLHAIAGLGGSGS